MNQPRSSSKPRLTQGRVLPLVRLVAALLVVLLVWGCGPNQSEEEKPLIKLHDSLSDSHWIANGIAEFIIEKGYGYPVETVVESTPAMEEALPRGEIHLNLEGWQQNIIEWYNSELEKGTIVNLGMIYEGGPQYFIIPQWVADEHDIKTVADMKEHWKLFQDPQDPSKGVFYNCISGWQCAKINQVKLEAYGLDEYYNLVSPGSSTALTAAFENAQENSGPVFGYYWEPSPLTVVYEWQILEEPPYNVDCWDKIMDATQDDAVRPVTQACAYQNLPIDKLAHAGLVETAPEVMEMLKAMVVGLEAIGSTMAWSAENNVHDGEKAAIHYLLNYKDRWRTWVTPEAYQRVQEAVDMAAQASP